MKNKLTISLLLFLPIWLSAQCLDCFDRDNDWRFAAGVTLYSNMTYPLEFSDYFHPFEFDFKYRLSDHNILRASIPIIWKRNIFGSTQVPHLPDQTTTLEQYVADLHSIDNSGYYDPVNVIENYATVLGLALGYEYNFPLMNKINISGGVDIGYTYQYIHAKYFALGYYHLDANNQSTLYQISYNINDIYDNILNIKPFVGINYQFEKLMIEANIGYYYCTYFVNQKYQEKDSDAYNVIRNATPLIKNWTFSLDKINYKISLFYTL
jgi:hypothetical protein